ncbi:MAG: hypothetical protein HY555_04030 [Euryarchaeota archaeon]|nr:hypothetical protein [Euryarchaeota archaeon]
MDLSQRSNQTFIIALLVVMAWLGLIALSSTLNIDKSLISGIEKVIGIIIGYYMGTSTKEGGRGE